MKLHLKRIALKETYTIGKLYVDDVFLCNSLEDKVRPQGEKVFGETAIPAGTYSVIYNYSPRFKRKLPRLLNVPMFDGILIHNGSNASHSHGCILVGKNTFKGGLTDSTNMMNVLCDKISKSKTPVSITIE